MIVVGHLNIHAAQVPTKLTRWGARVASQVEIVVA